jgi:thioredoxin reductase (NADPH)
MARRRNLRGSEAARSIEILGSEMSAGALALRTYAARQQLPHRWVEIDTSAGAALARAVTAAGGDLPVVITLTAVPRHATPALLAGHLGLSYQPVGGAAPGSGHRRRWPGWTGCRGLRRVGRPADAAA